MKAVRVKNQPNRGKKRNEKEIKIRIIYSGGSTFGYADIFGVR